MTVTKAPATIPAPRPSTRRATVADIVARLTGTQYASTAETALGWGMAPAQDYITEAVDAAIAAGLVRVVATKDTTYGRNIRFLAIASPAVHNITTCPLDCVTCATDPWFDDSELDL